MPTLNELKRRFNVRHATVVADQGMLSKDNLKALEKADLHYVVGARLKQLKEAAQDTLKAWRPDEAAVSEFKANDRRLVVSYSPKRAVRDAEAWNGLHGVYTSLPVADAPTQVVLNLYRGLWQVGAAFRVTKHDLQVRPVYHWKPERIEAHFAIAFMCLTLVRVLSCRVRIQQRTAMSEQRIRTALQQTAVAVTRATRSQARDAIPMPLTADAKKLYKVMNLPYRNESFVIA